MISTPRHRLLSLVAVLAVAPLLAGCSEDDGQETASEAECSYASDGSAASREVEPPSGDPTVDGDVPVTLETSGGTLNAVLDAKSAPCTVHSFVSLAEQGYFDDTQCHRLTTEGIFVLQCGDPTATGTGGPGYTVPDELNRAKDDRYPAGVLAMANTGQPDSGGSQFFIVYDDSSSLDPDYTVFGDLDADSLESVRAVAEQGTDTGASDGAPAEPFTITSVTAD